MKLNDNVYEWMKWGVLIFLPSLTTLVNTIGIALEWAGTQVAVTILVAFTTFLGGIIGISTVGYTKEQNDPLGGHNDGLQ